MSYPSFDSTFFNIINTGTDTEPVWQLVQQDISYIKTTLKMKVNELRKAKEIGGVLAPNGAMLATDPESQAKIAGVKVLCDLNPSILIDWKADNGWVQLNATDIYGIAMLVGSFIQNCFTCEKQHCLNIDNLNTFEELQNYNIYGGWN